MCVALGAVVSGMGIKLVVHAGVVPGRKGCLDVCVVLGAVVSSSTRKRPSF